MTIVKGSYQRKLQKRREQDWNMYRNWIGWDYASVRITKPQRQGISMIWYSKGFGNSSKIVCVKWFHFSKDLHGCSSWSLSALTFFQSSYLSIWGQNFFQFVIFESEPMSLSYRIPCSSKYYYLENRNLVVRLINFIIFRKMIYLWFWIWNSLLIKIFIVPFCKSFVLKRIYKLCKQRKFV